MVDDAPHLNDENSVDIRPWPAIELIGRAVVLATIARRGMLEVETERDVFDLETDRFDLLTWARTELQNWISDEELRLLNAPVGELNEDDLADCDDALIGASTIAWTIRVVPSEQLPLPQDGIAEEQVLEWAPEPWANVRQLVNRARIRGDVELAAERERWELWYWRATDADDASHGLQEVVAEVRESGVMPVADNDLATDGGIAFGTLSPDEQDDIAWLSELRLRSLNWACGFGESWETAPLYID
ncbi:MAG TPA: hypothetical protein VM450_09795 [Thermomicrobiales bacterium]|nr:hypothetical protein [Thermomicrobiales bacterium]